MLKQILQFIFYSNKLYGLTRFSLNKVYMLQQDRGVESGGRGGAAPPNMKSGGGGESMFRPPPPNNCTYL